jgi:type II secretory pathway pseudopilin PulG
VKQAVIIAILAAFIFSGIVGKSLEARKANRLELAQARAHAQELERLRDTITHLTIANQSIQEGYNDAQSKINSLSADRTRLERLRQQERATIAATARRIASACGDYAEASERHIERVEADAVRLGQEAAGASATAHALRDTLNARREALR